MPNVAALALFPTPAERAAAWATAAQGAPAAPLCVALAWMERERDPRASKLWAAKAQQAPGLTASGAMRLRLLALEAALIEGASDALPAQALALVAEFEAAGDTLGRADTHNLLARLAELRVDSAERRLHLAAALALAEQIGEPRRLLQWQADSVRTDTLVDALSIRPHRREALPTALEDLTDDCRATVAECHGVLAGLQGDFAPCLHWFGLAFEAALASGQMRRAIVLASNHGYIHGQMGSHDVALQWLDRGLGLAREGGWPGLTGGLLVHSAEVLRLLGQLDLARDSLREALTALTRLPSGRNLCTAHNTLGRVELEAGQHAAALTAFEAMQAEPAAHSGDLRTLAGIGRAKALLGLQRRDEALAVVDDTLGWALAQNQRQSTVEALGVKAEILSALKGSAEEALPLFTEALALAATLAGYEPDPRLLEAAAHSHASLGDFASAYALVTKALALRQVHFSKQTTQRMAGMRALHEVQTAKSDNEHLRQVAQLQEALMRQERHAALGAMVAGVAHELNTPIGNALLVTNSLHASMEALQAQLGRGEPLRRSGLRAVVAQQLEGLDILDGSMQTAARLVRSFKQVAVDRSSEARGQFRLTRLCEDCVQSLGLSLRQAGVGVRLTVDETVHFDSYPGALSQVLVVLLNNALLHAFGGEARDPEGDSPGREIRITARPLPAAQVEIDVSDNGVGIAPDALRRVFEPFFTTKFGQGGSGLGLSIAMSLVQNVLGGQLTLASTQGQGSCFTLHLPLSP